MTLPLLTVGGPYLVMKYAARLVLEKTGLDILQPYFLVTVPRIVMVVISFVADAFIYKICDKNNTRPWSTLRVWSSSHVVLIFLCRTFSNSYELILFAMLLYLVSDAMILTDRFIKKEMELQELYKKANYAVERVRIFKRQKEIPHHNYSHNLAIGALFALGVFNRPTFLLYAVVPLFFWMQRGMFLKKVGLADFHHRMFSLAPTFTVVCISLTIADSIFYGTVSSVTTLSIANLVIAPINFINYNMNPANVISHGEHPWFLHSLVNIPLLFNVIGIAGIYLVSRAVVSITCASWSTKPNLFNFNGLLLFSFAFPLITLSLTPHQEPRFLLPLLVPLVLLLGPFLIRSHGFWPKIMRSIWYAGNAVCILFFGFLHQGGIYGVQQFFRHNLLQLHDLTQTHIVYSHTYMPPVSLLTIADVESPSSAIARLRRSTNVHVEDFAGAPLEEVKARLFGLLEAAKVKWETRRIKSEIFTVIPATLDERVQRLFNKKESLVTLKTVKHSYVHLSMEDPPYLGDLCAGSSQGIQCQDFWPWFQNKGNQLALVIYQVNYSFR